MLTVKLAKPQKIMLDSEMSRAVWNNDVRMALLTRHGSSSTQGVLSPRKVQMRSASVDYRR